MIQIKKEIKALSSIKHPLICIFNNVFFLSLTTLVMVYTFLGRKKYSGSKISKMYIVFIIPHLIESAWTE